MYFLIGFARKYWSFVPFVVGILFSVLVALVYLMHVKTDIHIKLEIINNIAQLLVAASAVLAFSNYYERRQERIRVDALNQISYFREHILQKQNEISTVIKSKLGSNFEFHRVKSFNIDDIEASYTVEIINELVKPLQVDTVNSSVIDLLNALQQFAVTVDCYNLTNNPLLSSLRAAFVEIVEINIYSVTYNRTVGTAPSVYNSVLNLYKSWEPSVDRKTPEQRLTELKLRVRK